MTLAAPDKTNFSTVFINNTQNEKTFAIKTSDLNLSVDARISGPPSRTTT